MAISSAKKHVLIFPFPGQGHMIPLLDLIHHLASTTTLTFTILVTPKNLPFLTPLLTSHPTSINSLTFPFPPHPSIPSGAENAKDVSPAAFIPMIYALGQLQDPLYKWFKTHDSPPVAIISDMFFGWTHKLAVRLGIRRFVFSPSGAMALSVINSLWIDMPVKKNSDDYMEVFEFKNLPHCPKYPWWQISPIYRSYVRGDPVSEFLKEGLVDNVASYGLVINSFDELEGDYLNYLGKEMGHNRIWAVGPLLPPSEDDGKERGGSSSVSVDVITNWLDLRDDHSVVYICFGSQAVLTNPQTAAIAEALEKSRVHFVWSMKKPTSEHINEDNGETPDGFENRVGDRGLLIRGWAPQVSILSHRSVGAFLSHCGWNSVIESVLKGVPLLTWPLAADQFTNAILLVDQLKVAVRACEGVRAVPDPDELARVFVESVSEGSKVERDRVKVLSEAAIEAVDKNGTSFKDLNGFVKHIGGF